MLRVTCGDMTRPMEINRSFYPLCTYIVTHPACQPPAKDGPIPAK